MPITPLRFWTDPGDGTLPYEVDLREFAGGGRFENIAPQARHSWTGDFAGRPKFAAQFAEMLRLQRLAEDSATASRAAMRAFFRFLDKVDPLGDVADVSGVNDRHGSNFRQWLEDGNGARSFYRVLKTTVGRMRELQALPPLFWPARNRDEPTEQDDIDQVGMRRFFHALKDEGRQIKAMFRQGERLACEGGDPRARRTARGLMLASWDVRENHAWLVRSLTQERLLSKREFLAEGAAGLHNANDVETQKFDGPEYLAPGMTSRGREGIVGKLRWFYPSYHDTAIFLWLFLIGTGWNLATALGLDVTEPDPDLDRPVRPEMNWAEDHPQKPEFKVLHSFKGRADRHVFALSMCDPEWHPYQIIKFMISRTAVLRQTVQYQLKQARERQRGNPTPKILAEIARLEAMARSPWLYHVVNEVGRIGVFTHDDSAKLNKIARLAAVRKPNLIDRHPQIQEITTSIARDAWIGHAYVQSGYHVLLTRLASQHSTSRTLKFYLNRRRFRAHSEQQTRLWQKAVFSEIESGRILDHTRIRILVTKGVITPEQEMRLLDIRQRTRLGMGCLDPTGPPREVSPDHKAGELCRVQRCTGCHLGVVFEASLPYLARAYAELRFLQGQLPHSSWQGSSFEDELDSLEETLRDFTKERVDVLVEAWTTKLKSGEIRVHDTYPSY
ncbi:hypothetical protein BB934_01785 [Microvirga ossetica]|uniref:Uncharacterized protein n=1 Tax=Microvirga ossetica TaxID=1882682 RepID=A0A1B2ENI2_9HYPH|nr:hypothetical protein BB934_01785 [Microvirga ossetica]